jgi:serine/threonine protein kinase
VIKNQNYNIVQLGQGKYTQVYCMELDNDRQVAVKVLKPAYEKNKYFQDQLIREAKMGMQVHHPSIRRVKDLIHDDIENTYQVMMEFLDGYNMKDYIQNFGSINENQIFEWLKFFLPGLIEIHRNGLVHGLLKPGNFILNPMGKLKVCDLKGPYFESELFPENVEAEDVLYLSPEQIQHIGPISASSDIYSLGVTLYTLLTGKLPYSEDSPDIDEMRLRILNDPLPFVDFATVKMNGIIQAATAKNPNERFANFESMLLEIGGELNVKQSTLFSTTKRNIESELSKDNLSVPQFDQNNEPLEDHIHHSDVLPVELPSYSSKDDAVDEELDFNQSGVQDLPKTSAIHPDKENEVIENDEIAETETNQSLDDRIKAVWDRIGATSTSVDPKVDKVAVVTSTESKKPTSKAKPNTDEETVTVTPKKKLAVRTVSPDFTASPTVVENKKQDPVVHVEQVDPPKAETQPMKVEAKVEVPVVNPTTTKKSFEKKEVNDMESEGKRKVFSARMFLGFIVTFTLIVGSIYAYYTFNRQVPPTIISQESSTDSSESNQAGIVAATTEISEEQQAKVDSLIQADSGVSLLDLEKAKLAKLAEIKDIKAKKEKEANELKALKDQMAQFEILGSYNNNIAPFRFNNQIGFVSKDGKIVKKPLYEEILSYSNGLAPVNLNGKWGFVNFEGKEVIKPKYNEIFGFSKGLAGAKKDNKWGFINATGQVAVPFKYDVVTDFAEGYSGVRKNSKWGFVTKDGNEVIPCQFDNAWSFNNGLAGVEKNDKWGFINTKGQVVIPLEYGQVNNFAEGLACVEKNGKFGFINKEGKELVKCQYEAAKPFKNGTARVFDDGKWFYINKSGKCVRDCN